MHHTERYVEHDYAPNRDPEPCRECHRHVLIRYVIYSKLLKHMFRHICPEAERSQDPHEEPVKLGLCHMGLFAGGADVVDLLLGKLVFILVVLEVFLREVDRRYSPFNIFLAHVGVVVLVTFIWQVTV